MMIRNVLCLGLLAALAVPASADIVFNTNLLTNAGFEDGLNGWTTDGAAVRQTNPPPHGGQYYLIGSFDGFALTTTFQLIEFDEPLADDLTATFGGWQAGWQTQRDSGLIELAALDAAGDVLASDDLGWFYSNHTWVFRDGELPLPAGTTALRYTFTAQRYDGYNNDGYLDDAFVSIVPEPVTFTLLALGGAAIVRRR